MTIQIGKQEFLNGLKRTAVLDQLTTDICRKNNGKIYSLENCEFITQKENISYQNKMKKFKATNNNGEVFYSNNQKQFSLFCGVPDKKINEILRKKRKSYHKWTFEYCDT